MQWRFMSSATNHSCPATAANPRANPRATRARRTLNRRCLLFSVIGFPAFLVRVSDFMTSVKSRSFPNDLDQIQSRANQ